jgi:hypothetical protein
MPEEDRFELHEGAFAANSPSYVLKFERATELMIDLAHESENFVDTLLTSPLMIELREEGWISVKWGEVPPLPMKWRLYIGDYLHNLRTALDHMVYDMGVTHGLARLNHLQFPIVTDEAQWTNQVEAPQPGKPGPLAELPAEVVQAIRATQPFTNAGKRKRAHDPLVVLLRMENIDKHRIVHDAVIAQSDARIGFDPPGSVQVTKKRRMPGWRMLVTDGEIARVKVRGIKQGTKVEKIGWAARPKIFCRPRGGPDDSTDAAAQLKEGTDTLDMLTRVYGVGRALASHLSAGFEPAVSLGRRETCGTAGPANVGA